MNHRYEVVPISRKYRKTNTLSLVQSDQSLVMPIVLGVLFFFVVCLGSADSIKGTVIAMAAIALITIAARFKVLRERLSWPFIALMLVVLMDGISTFYAVSGKFALREFLKVFLAFLTAVVLLSISPKKEEKTGTRIAEILATATAVGGFIGIDTVSTGLISGAVVRLLDHFTVAYTEYDGVQQLVRMSSIFSNANVYAGFSGLGSILGLGLVHSAQSRKKRCFYLVLLYLNLLAFFLTISLGAFFFAVIAFFAFVMLQAKEKRGGALLFLLETIVLAGAAALLLITMPEAEAGTRRILPLAAAVVGAAAYCLLDTFVLRKIASRPLGISGRTAAVIIVIAVAAFAAYAGAALSVTSAIDLAPESTIDRLIFPKPGTYTLNVAAQGDSIKIRVYSRTLADIANNTYTTIYAGNALEAECVVPEDSVMVHVRFTSPDGIRIDSADLGSYSIPLDYVLMPDILVRRLTNVGTVRNIAQRLVYFQDGIKIFRRSPVFGLGMGAFENAIKGVQSYYYETKYAHNHYFQTLLETGIIGLLLFIFLLVSSAAAVWKSRKQQPFAPMLGAAWVFMAGQALHDIVFSSYSYLPVAYGIFALIALCCGDALEKPKLSRTVRSVGIGVMALCTVIYCGFLIGNMTAKRAAERNLTFQTLQQSAKQDRFEWADYALPYVMSAKGDDIDPAIRQQADAFAQRLATVDSNTIPIYLAEYYFETGRTEQAIRMIEKYVDYVSSDESAWNSAVSLLRDYAEDSEAYRSGVRRIAQKLDDWNSANIGHITLSQELGEFLDSYLNE